MCSCVCHDTRWMLSHKRIEMYQIYYQTYIGRIDVTRQLQEKKRSLEKIAQKTADLWDVSTSHFPYEMVSFWIE